jgi:hypothetical protein
MALFRAVALTRCWLILPETHLAGLFKQRSETSLLLIGRYRYGHEAVAVRLPPAYRCRVNQVIIYNVFWLRVVSEAFEKREEVVFAFVGQQGWSIKKGLNCLGVPACSTPSGLALQLLFLRGSESMGNHDSKIVGADSVD